jgi:hypothetical protein
MILSEIYAEAGLGVTEIALVESYIEDDDGRFIETKAYEKLYDYFCNNGEMPYLVAKARTGDPDAWILDYLTCN